MNGNWTSDFAQIVNGNTGTMIRMVTPRTPRHRVYSVAHYYGAGAVANLRGYLQFRLSGVLVLEAPFDYGLGTAETRPFVAGAAAGLSPAQNARLVRFDDQGVEFYAMPTEFPILIDEVLFRVERFTTTVAGFRVWLGVESLPG